MTELKQVTRPTRDIAPLLYVIFAGLFTTALALAGVWLAERRFREPILSGYAYYFIPWGAIVVGLVAASGYLVAAMIIGLRAGKRLIWTFFALQVVAYFVAQYVECRAAHLVYTRTGEPIGFWTYFHHTATSYTLEQDGRAPVRLEYLGYFFRLLEIACFAGGAALLIGALSQSPYCATCGRYLKKKRLATIHAGDFFEVDENATPEEAETAFLAAGQTAFDGLVTIAQAGDATTFADQIKDHPPASPTAKASSRLDLEMTYCPACMEASVKGTVIMKKTNSTRTEMLKKQNVPAALAERIVRG